MGTNGFREDELITRKVNGQTKVFPVVGGRLRLAHEENQNLSLKTEMVSWDGQYAIFKCSAVTSKGQFVGYGTANSQRDARLADSLVELAETRAIARALRFGGIGVEYTGAEEISHVATAESEAGQSTNKTPRPVFSNANGRSEAESKTSGDGIDPGGGGSKPQHFGSGRATQAQVRALFALSKRANYHDDDIAQLLAPFEVARFEDLPREAASKLIGSLQIEAA